MGRIYRPRMALRMTVPLDDAGVEVLTFDAPVRRATWTSNDHNHADTLTVNLAWKDAGVDPRYIAGATASLFLGNADAFGSWEPLDADRRFVGRLSKSNRSAGAETLGVELSFVDYTSFFLLAKPFASRGVPDLSRTLDDAWKQICLNTPGAAPLMNSIEFRGVGSPPKIGDAVSPRFAKLKGKVPVKQGADAWAVWQQCVGMCGLISYFEFDRCVVTTAEDYYTGDDPPRLVWGENIASFSEDRSNDFETRAVGITSFNPLTGKTIEAVYDPLGETKGKSTSGAPGSREKVDYFQYAGIQDEKRLLDLAKRVYEERSRQAVEGRVATAEMRVATASGDEFDLLSLRSGDTVEVRFLGAAEASLAATIPTEQARIKYLMGRGYDEAAARIVAKQVAKASTRPEQFYAKTVTTTLEATPDGGSFQVEIGYANKIDTNGALARG